jgi:hypothetical protein
MKLFSFLKRRSFYSVTLSVVLSIAFVSIVATAATTISTNVNTGGSLTVTGESTLTGAIFASSTLAVDGAVTFNDNSTGGTNDFRVESDSNTAMLIVDASADRIGIGTTTPVAMLSVGTDTANSVTGDVYLTGALTVGATTTINSFEGSILFSNQHTGDPSSGADEGMVYYNATDKVLRMYDGSAWFTVGTSTGGLSTAGGGNRRVQMSNVSTDHLALGTTTIQSESLLTLEATTTTAIPLTIVGATAQTGDLFNIQRCDNCVSSYTEVFSIDAYGSASTTGSFDLAYHTDTAYLSVSGRATTTSVSGDFDTEGSIFASSTITLDGSFHVYGVSTTTASNGNIATEGTLAVGPSQNRTALNRMVAGFCVLDEVTVDATTTAFANCTGATGVSAGDRIMVQATSSLASTTNLIITGASSTSGVADVISVLLLNLGYSSGTASTISEGQNSGVSINFWAFR